MSNINWDKVKAKAPIALAITAGVAGTAAIFTAIHDTFKLIEKHPEFDDNCYMHKKSPGEIFRKAIPCYILTIALWTISIASLISSAALDARQKASLIAAYAMINKAYSDYASKNEDHAEVRAKQAKEAVKDVDPNYEGELYYEGYFGEYFCSTPEDLLTAEYELNRKFISDGCVSLNYFYELLGLGHCEQGDVLGWSIVASEDFYGYPWIDFSHEKVKTDDGLECTIIEFTFPPTPDYLF